MTALNIWASGPMAGRHQGHPDERPAGQFWRMPAAIAATILAGPLAGGIGFLATVLITPMAPIIGVVAGATAQFAAAHLAVHRLGLAPVSFLKGHFAGLWGVLFCATLAMLVGMGAGAEGTDAGRFTGPLLAGVLLAPPVLAALLTALPALAVGDKDPGGPGEPGGWSL